MRLFIRILLGLSVVLIGLVAFLHVRAKNQRDTENQYLATLKKNISVTSNSFPPNGDLPVNCSCKGKELSPALVWETNLPDAESYVVLATDYDAPSADFPLFNVSHWVVYNIPPSVRSLPEGVTSEQMHMLGGKVGKNSRGNSTFAGPCPSVGRHAYLFRVYALDQLVSFSMLPDKQAMVDAMKGHVLGYGELTGYFQ